MESNDVLDANLIEQEENEMLKSIEWWENKRLLYTVLVVSVGMVVISLFPKGFLNFGIIPGVIWVLIYVTCANFLYSVGWAVDLFLKYYKLHVLNKMYKNSRIYFFIFGVLFSLYFTVYVFKDILYYYSH